MNRIKIVSLVCIICLFSMQSIGQIKLVRVDGKTELVNIEYNKDLQLNAEILINETITKYDKIMVCVVKKKKTETEWGSCQTSADRTLFWLPKSDVFKDKYAGQKKIVFSLDMSYFENERLNFETYEYCVEVYGYFESGTEVKWDEYSKSTKRVQLYTYSKDAAVTDPFTFKRDEIAEKEAKEKELKAAQEKEEAERIKKLSDESYTNMKIIKEEYTKEITLPVGTVQPKIDIYNAYELLRKDLVSKKDYDSLIKVEQKLIAIKDSKAKGLKKALEGLTDTNEIMRIILEYQPE